MSVRSATPKPTYFTSPDAFRRWLERHHATSPELWVGFHKRATGRPSLSWPESVDVALCFGWIDGIRKSIDDERYTIRFTPRRRSSRWSLINVRRVAALQREGRMRPAGRAAFEARREARTGTYSYEQRPRRLDRRSLEALRARPKAWAFYHAQAPWYRRVVAFWVLSAKREETRARRLATLIEHSARGRYIPGLEQAQPKRSRAGR
jgi:uncharacterized protein YdeI (YjbR/CyaY-like superfamily)